MIERVSGLQAQAQAVSAKSKKQAQATSFGDVMQQELSHQNVKFSKHALSRAEERGIQITPKLMDQLQGSMKRAQEKGATNILAMDAQTAFIINVPRARVITAITQDEMKTNVFTNIDGAVFL